MYQSYGFPVEVFDREVTKVLTMFDCCPPDADVKIRIYQQFRYICNFIKASQSLQKDVVEMGVTWGDQDKRRKNFKRICAAYPFQTQIDQLKTLDSGFILSSDDPVPATADQESEHTDSKYLYCNVPDDSSYLFPSFVEAAAKTYTEIVGRSEKLSQKNPLKGKSPQRGPATANA